LVHAELTTQKGADMLNISRPTFVKVLDEGKIPFHRTGNRRKVKFADVHSYKLERTRSFMHQNVRSCLVTGFEQLIPGIELPDADDLHVVAAAIHTAQKGLLLLICVISPMRHWNFLISEARK